MTTTAASMRLTVQSVKSMYKDGLPAVNENLYKSRSYTLAAGKCYAAAYAAAVFNRDNMAMQFYRAALLVSNALAPVYPKDRDRETGNEIDRNSEDQIAMDSRLQAAQMGIASEYGLLTYLAEEKKGTPFLFIVMYQEAHKACRVAYDEAKSLRHSPIDADFAEVLKQVVNAIGVYYNTELAVWTEPVKAAQESRKPKLTPDTFIAETTDQRRQHSAAELDAMIQGEQAQLGKLGQRQAELAEKLADINDVVEKQVEATQQSEEVYEKIKEEADTLRKDLEKQNGRLSELSKERSDLRVDLAVVDGDYFLLTERLQTLVNLRAYSS